MRRQKWSNPSPSRLLPRNWGTVGFAWCCPATFLARRWCCLFCRHRGAACEERQGPGEHPARCCSASAPEHPTRGCEAKHLAPARWGIRDWIRPPHASAETHTMGWFAGMLWKWFGFATRGQEALARGEGAETAPQGTSGCVTRPLRLYYLSPLFSPSCAPAPGSGTSPSLFPSTPVRLCAAKTPFGVKMTQPQAQRGGVSPQKQLHQLSTSQEPLHTRSHILNEHPANYLQQ